MLYKTILDAAPTCFTSLPKDETAAAQGPSIIIYGMQNGNFGAMELQDDEAIVLWEMDCNMEESKAPISHIKVA